jgi:hypothetical protein
MREHYSNCIDQLNLLEEDINRLVQIQNILEVIQEKAERGDDVYDLVSTTIEINNFLIEKLDLRFAEVWNATITKHPGRPIPLAND